MFFPNCLSVIKQCIWCSLNLRITVEFDVNDSVNEEPSDVEETADPSKSNVSQLFWIQLLARMHTIQKENKLNCLKYCALRLNEVPYV